MKAMFQGVLLLLLGINLVQGGAVSLGSARPQDVTGSEKKKQKIKRDDQYIITYGKILS